MYYEKYLNNTNRFGKGWVTENNEYVVPDNFPNSEKAPLKIIDDVNDDYNCISYALCVQTKWIDPWYFDAESANRGFINISENEIDTHQEVIAVYEDDYGITHAALKVGNVWHSKIGANFLVEHQLQDIERGIYGKVSFFMAKVQTSTSSDDLDVAV